jgi:hypothetical protein
MLTCEFLLSSCGAQAMHSERILIFEPENSKLRKAGVGAYGNVLVGIRRRYNNVLVDAERQQQMDIFLGLKHGLYFPQTRLLYRVRAGDQGMAAWASLTA